MRKMKQRALSWVLAIAMALSMVPAGILPAFADSEYIGGAVHMTGSHTLTVDGNGNVSGKIKFGPVSSGQKIFVALISGITYQGEYADIPSDYESVKTSYDRLAGDAIAGINETNLAAPALVFSIDSKGGSTMAEYDISEFTLMTAGISLTTQNVDQSLAANGLQMDGNGYIYHVVISTGNSYVGLGTLELGASTPSPINITLTANASPATDGYVSIEKGATATTATDTASKQQTGGVMPSFQVYAAPKPGYHFVGWSTDNASGYFDGTSGSTTSTSANTTYTPGTNGDTITAEFEKNTPSNLVILDPIYGEYNSSTSNGIDPAQGNSKEIRIRNDGDTTAVISGWSYVLNDQMTTISDYVTIVEGDLNEERILPGETKTYHYTIDWITAFTDYEIAGIISDTFKLEYSDAISDTMHTSTTSVTLKDLRGGLLTSPNTVYLTAVEGYADGADSKKVTFTSTAGEALVINSSGFYDNVINDAYTANTSWTGEDVWEITKNGNFVTDDYSIPAGESLEVTFTLRDGLPAGTYTSAFGFENGFDGLTPIWTVVTVTIEITPNDGPLLSGNSLNWLGVYNNYTSGTSPAQGKTLTLKNKNAPNAKIKSVAESGNGANMFTYTPAINGSTVNGKGQSTYTVTPKAGLKFDSTSKQPDGSHKYVDTVTITYNDPNDSYDNGTTTVTFTVEMVGTISFNVDYTGGTNPTSVYTDTYGKVPTLPTPSRTGYTFGGWYTGQNGTGTKVEAGNTVEADTQLYANWTQDTYTATVITKNNTTAQALASDVRLMTSATDNSPVPMTKDSTDGSKWTKSGLASNAAYTHAKVELTSGLTYVVALSAPIDATNNSADAVFYQVTLAADTTVSGSGDPYGTVTAAAGGASVSTAKSGNVYTASFLAPEGAAIALSNTPAANYKFKEWWIGGSSNTQTNGSYSYTMGNAAIVLTGRFEPLPAIEVTPATASLSLRVGNSGTVVSPSANGTDGNGWVKNTGKYTTGTLDYKITSGTFDASTPSWTSSGLTVTLDTAALAAGAGKGITVDADATSLTAGQSYEATVWVYDKNDPTVRDSIVITINVSASAELNVGTPTTWDTYTGSLSGAASSKSKALTLKLDSKIASVTSITMGSVTLTAGTDYVVAPQGIGTDTCTVTLLETGLKKLAGDLTTNNPNASTVTDTLTVTVVDGDNQTKSATTTLTVVDSMPSLTAATFGSTTWTLGDATQPSLTVTDSKSNTGTLPGEVVYAWTKNGQALKDANNDDFTGANLTADILGTLAVGDKIEVTVTGVGKHWDPQTSAKAPYDEVYQNYTSQTASFTVVAPTVSTQIQVDGDNPTTTHAAITASAAQVGVTGNFNITTSTTGHYRFDKWEVATTNGGAITDATQASTTFTPKKAATLTAKWLSLASLEYGNDGANATGPDSGAKVYSDVLKNVGPGGTTPTMVLGGTDAANFTFTPPTGAGGANDTTGKTFTVKPNPGLAPGEYTFTITTTYLEHPNDDPGTATKTIVQTVKYTVEAEDVELTLKKTAGGYITAAKGGTTATTQGKPTNDVTQKITVTSGDTVVMTATAETGYKFNSATNAGWKTTSTADTFSTPLTASNSYGPVSQAATLEATFKPVTDLSESHTQSSANAVAGYSGTPDVYVGALSNDGALQAGVTYALKDQKMNNVAAASGTNYFSIPAATSDTNLATILARTSSGASTGKVSVVAVNGLAAGTYTATLVITEGTAADDTMSGTPLTREVELTFIVTAAPVFEGSVTVTLDGTAKTTETVKLRPANGNSDGSADVDTTYDAGSYKANSALQNSTTYTIFVNGVNTGLTLSTGNKSQEVKLWTLTTSVTPANSGTVSVSGGTTVTVKGATSTTTATGYLDGTAVTLSATANAGYKFKQWTGDASGTNQATNVTISKATSVTAEFDPNVGLKYYENHNSALTDESDLYITTATVTGNSVTLLAAPPAWTGHTFVGWSFDRTTAATASSGIMKGNTSQNTSSWTASDGYYKLYAIWKQTEASWTSIPDGVYGDAYSGTAAITNGADLGAVQSYAVTGALPAGLTMNGSTGEITGKPQVTGTFTFTVTFTNKDGKTWTNNYTLKVNKATPTVTAVSFDNVADGGNIADVKITATVTAPFYNKASTNADKWETKTYQYTDYVSSSNVGTTVAPAKDAGSVAITAPTGTTLNFNNQTAMSGTVTFTPSNTATGYGDNSAGNLQTYESIYNSAAGNGILAIDGKKYGVKIDQTGKTLTQTVNLGGTLPTASDWTFDVWNTGNQDSYVTYTAVSGDTSDFTLTPVYDAPATGTKTSDSIAKPGVGETKTVSSNAFSVAPNSGISNLVPGVYTLTVEAKSYDNANLTGDPKATDRITLVLKVQAVDYTAKVDITLHGAGGSTTTRQKLPAGAVEFVEIGGTTTKSSTWTKDATADVPGCYYSDTLTADKSYSLKVNGYVIPGVVISATNTTATVELYEVAVVSGDSTLNPSPNLSASPAYVAAGQTSTVTAQELTGHDFVKWTKGADSSNSTAAHTTAKEFVYQMPTTDPAAVTFKAHYKTTDATIVHINYHDNVDSAVIVVPAPTDVTLGAQGTIDPGKPVRPGYTFVGWSTKQGDDNLTGFDATNNNTIPANLTTGRYDVVSGQTPALSKDLDLYAVWQKETATWPTAAADTYYGDHYTASVGITSGVTTAVTYTLLSKETLPIGTKVPAGAIINNTVLTQETTLTADTEVSYKLPGGLKLNSDGTITGRPWEVVTNKPFKVVATNADGVTWTSGTMTITVDKAETRLVNISGTGATTGSAVTTGTYTADVVADILKTKDPSDPDKDVWEDGKTIATGVEAGKTTAADGGELAVTSTGNFTSGLNTVDLTWTPGASNGSYPLVDGNSSSFGTIYKPATGKANLSTTGDTYGLSVTEKSHTWTVKPSYTVADHDGTNDGKVVSNKAYGLGFILTNDGNQAIAGSLTYSFGKTGNNAIFELEATPAASLAANGSLTFYVKPKTGFDTTVPAVYQDVLTITDEIAKTSVTVYLTLVVEESATFDIEVNTYLNSFAADNNSTAVAGTRALGDVTSVVLVASDNTTVNPTRPTSNATGKYEFNGLDSSKTYTLKVNGVAVKAIGKSDADDTIEVDLYQVAVAHDGNGQADPTASPSDGYYLPGQAVTVTAGSAKSGYVFKDWTLTTENGATADTVETSKSSNTAYTHTIDATTPTAVKLTATYTEQGKVYTVVLNANGGTLTYFTPDGGTAQTHADVLTGGTKSGNDYQVNDGATFGLSTPVTTLVGNDYSISKANYTFAGWSTDPNAATGSYRFTASATLAAGDGDSNDSQITLYAIWVEGNGLTVQPATVTGTYKQPSSLTQTGPTLVGGTAASFATTATVPFGTTLNGTTGAISAASGKPNDVGSETITVTITDTAGNTVDVDYTITIGKADVEPNATKGLPTDPVTAKDTDSSDDIKNAVLDSLKDTQMDGVQTGEEKINGTWEVDESTIPTTPGTHKVKVTFKPENNGAATGDRQKDGDHYNEYTTEIEVVVERNKLITFAGLDTAGLMAPKAGETPKDADWLRGTANNTLTATNGMPSYASDATGTDVYISNVSWAPKETSDQFQANTTYTVTVTLQINEDSDYRFDKANFAGTIAGKNATVETITDTIAILKVQFNKDDALVDKIHVTTTQPAVNGYNTTVGVIPADYNKYEVTKQTWYKAGGTTDDNKVENADGKTFQEKQADGTTDQLYDLVVEVTAKSGYKFDKDTFNKAVNADLKTGTSNTDADWDARVTQGTDYTILVAPEGAHTAKVEAVLNAECTKITIRYASFKPADKVVARVELTEGELTTQHYYATTGTDKKLNGSDVEDIKDSIADHKSGVNAVFSDASTIKIKVTYTDGNTDTKTVSDANTHLYYWNGTTFIKLEDGYVFKNENTPTDQTTYDGQQVYVGYDISGTPVIADRIVGTLTVREVKADGIAASDSSKVTYRYEATGSKNFAADTTNLTASVDFNSDSVGKLAHTVSGMQYVGAAVTGYAALTAGSGKYFFEVGAPGAPAVSNGKSDWTVNVDNNGKVDGLEILVPGASVDGRNGQMVYISYLDVNGNIVRTPLNELSIGGDLSVTVTDENGHDPEYGDKLTAKPSGTGPYEYQWEVWEPASGEDKDKDPTKPGAQGKWEPLPNGTNPDYYPDKNDVGKYIRVEVTDSTGSIVPGNVIGKDPILIQPRSINFDVKSWDKSEDNTIDNIHEYDEDDFTPTNVKKDMTKDSDTSGTGKPVFDTATTAYGGVLPGDLGEVTIEPNTTWNTSDTTRPLYSDKKANVGEITWPAVSPVGTPDGSSTVPASKVTDYVLYGPMNNMHQAVYRLAPQDSLSPRGKIWKQGGSIVHVDVSFEHTPIVDDVVPGTPMGVTDERETRPGENKGNDTDQNYVATWYTGVEGVTDPFADFDPTNVDSNKVEKAGTRFEPDKPYTVVVAVKPQPEKEYDLTGSTPTKFYFHFGTDKEVEVRTDGAYDKAGNKISDGKLTVKDGVYYMWFTFAEADGEVQPPQLVGDPAIEAGQNYYAKTGTTDKHHAVATTADHNPIPGGKKSVQFDFALSAARTAIEAKQVKINYRGADVTLTSANYGTEWRLVAGPTPAAAKGQYLDVENNGSYVGYTFRDDLTKPVAAADYDSVKYDGANIYIEHVASGTVFDAPVEVLNVKELTAEDISATGSLKLDYTEGNSFVPTGVTGASVAFNQDTDVEPTEYKGAQYADGADTEGKKYYFEYRDYDAATGAEKFKPLTASTTITKSEHHGKIAYICYTDVNGHVVRKPLGTLTVSETDASTAAIYVKNNTQANKDTEYGDVLEAMVVGTNNTFATTAGSSNYTIRWERRDPAANSDWEPIQIGGKDVNTKTYIASKADVGKFIRAVLVTDGDKVVGTVTSDGTVPADAMTDLKDSNEHIYVDKKKITADWTWNHVSKPYDGNTTASNTALSDGTKAFTYDTDKFDEQLVTDSSGTADDFDLTDVTAANFADDKPGYNKEITLTGGGLPSNWGDYYVLSGAPTGHITQKVNVDVLGYVETAPKPGSTSASPIKPADDAPYTATTPTDNWYSDAECKNKVTTFEAGKTYYAKLTVQLKDDKKDTYEFSDATKGYMNGVAGADVSYDPDTGTVTIIHPFEVDKDSVHVEVDSATPTPLNKLPETITPGGSDKDKYTFSDAKWTGSLNDDKVDYDTEYTLTVTVTPVSGVELPTDKNGYTWNGQVADSVTPAGDDGTYTAIFKYKTPEKTTISGEVTPIISVGQPKKDQPTSSVTPSSDNKTVASGKDEGWFESTVWRDKVTNEVITKFGDGSEEKTYVATIYIKDQSPIGDTVYKEGDTIYVNGAAATVKKDGEGNLYVEYEYTIPKETTNTTNTIIQSGGGGTTIIETPVVTYALRDLGVTLDLTAEKVKKNGNPKAVPNVQGITGLKFVGWSETDPSKLSSGKLPTLVNPTTFKITADKTFYAVYEKVDDEFDHSHYVIGFPNGTFGPDNQITRGQVATIIARACLENFIEGGNYGNPGNYSDVEGHWAFSAISYCSMRGVFTGYDDGTFRPDQYITRQELATVVARLAGVQISQGLPFSDSGDIADWAVNGVYTNYANGWVNGYTDGTFKPLNDISRAETVKIFNGYLGRGTDREGLSELREYVHSGVASNNTENGKDEYMTWPDVAKTHWAYYEIIEAANDHNFHWRDASKETPPEDWYECYIDEVWRYEDDANDGADNVGRDDTLPVFTVTYVLQSSGVVWDSITEEVTKFESPSVEKLPQAVPSEGYRFAGWSETDPDTGVISLIDPTAHPVLEDKTFYAVFEPDVYEMPKVTITYVIGEHGSTDMALTEVIDMWESPTVANLPEITAHAGWEFVGWSETDPAAGTVTLTDPTDHPALADTVFYAVYEQQAPAQPEEPVAYARYRYINGYTDNTFRPDAAFTRAAMATVIASLMGYDPNTAYAGAEFDDLEDHWGANAIAFCVSQGLMSGYTDNTFRPDNAISRQEFAVVLARLAGETMSGELPFADVDGIASWALDSVYTAYTKGWINGYDDGAFLPERNVTRAEAVKMFNGYLGRLANRENIASHTGYTTWSDVPETHWAYYEIIEASNNWLW